ncbi:MAG TPA: DNA-processing protein DprA, partial [Thermomicrobiales bacterium]|nr:DNA-processing protein DprA [Thermomicrobiales bacterium]
MERDDTKYWVAFHQAPYIGPVRIERLRRHFGDLERAWAADARALAAVLDGRAVENLLRTRRALDPDREMERIARCCAEAIALDNPRYPRLLREISAPPPVLYVRGELTAADDVAVAIVGTRRASASGREIAGRLGEDLAAAGVTIVSGLARGIDGAAHQAALRAEGRTIAVLGSGPDVIYPPEHRLLAERIADRGAVLSDYPPGRKPDAMNFPARNRIISGLSLGVVLVEAPAKSGALITADFAADQGRDVFVAPGSMLAASSAGSNALLRDGARA